MSVINVRKKELNKNGYKDFEHWNGISDDSQSEKPMQWHW